MNCIGLCYLYKVWWYISFLQPGEEVTPTRVVGNVTPVSPSVQRPAPPYLTQQQLQMLQFLQQNAASLTVQQLVKLLIFMFLLLVTVPLSFTKNRIYGILFDLPSTGIIKTTWYNQNCLIHFIFTLLNRYLSSWSLKNVIKKLWNLN